MNLITEIGTLQTGKLQTVIEGKEVWVACIDVNGESGIECLGSTEEDAIERRRYVLEAIAFYEGRTDELFK